MSAARRNATLAELTDKRLDEAIVKFRRVLLWFVVLLIAGVVAGVWVDWRIGLTAVLVLAIPVILALFAMDAALEEQSRRRPT